MTNPRIEVFANADPLTRAAAQLFTSLVRDAVEQRGLGRIVLSGGSTPKKLFALLAQSPAREEIPWAQLHCYWADERLVPPHHAESNYGEAQRLLFDFVPIPPENVHRMKGELPMDEAVADYRRQLSTAAEPALVFDAVWLGLGEDGHTASLFPGPVSAEENTQPVMGVTADYQGRPAQRITLTPYIFNQARQIIFLTTGSNKAVAVHAVLHGPHAPENWPAQRICPLSGHTIWLLDHPAARLLPQGNV